MWINRKKYQEKIDKTKEQNQRIKELENELKDQKLKNRKAYFESNNKPKFKKGDTIGNYLITDVQIEGIMKSKTTAYGLAFLMSTVSYSFLFPRRYHGTIPLRLQRNMKKHLEKGFFYEYTVFDLKKKETSQVEESFLKRVKKEFKKKKK